MSVKSFSQAGQLGSAPSQRPPNPGQRVLVVEKDADLRRLNSEILTCSGYRVDAAEDGAAAWVALQSNYYDLMVTENSLPKVSGVELVRKLYADQADLPVIMTTSEQATWEFAKYPWLQPATLLLKPYTFEELLKTVKEVLHATASIRNEIAPPPNWQSPPATPRLRPGVSTNNL